MLVSDGSIQACQSPMGIFSYRWGILVSNGSEMGLRSGMSVSDEAYLEVSDGSPIRHVSVSNVACRGLPWVSDQACRPSKKYVEVFYESPFRHVCLQ